MCPVAGDPQNKTNSGDKRVADAVKRGFRPDGFASSFAVQTSNFSAKIKLDTDGDTDRDHPKNQGKKSNAENDLNDDKFIKVRDPIYSKKSSMMVLTRSNSSIEDKTSSEPELPPLLKSIEPKRKILPLGPEPIPHKHSSTSSEQEKICKMYEYDLAPQLEPTSNLDKAPIADNKHSKPVSGENYYIPITDPNYKIPAVSTFPTEGLPKCFPSTTTQTCSDDLASRNVPSEASQIPEDTYSKQVSFDKENCEEPEQPVTESVLPESNENEAESVGNGVDDEENAAKNDANEAEDDNNEDEAESVELPEQNTSVILLREVESVEQPKPFSLKRVVKEEESPKQPEQGNADEANKAQQLEQREVEPVILEGNINEASANEYEIAERRPIQHVFQKARIIRVAGEFVEEGKSLVSDKNEGKSQMSEKSERKSQVSERSDGTSDVRSILRDHKLLNEDPKNPQKASTADGNVRPPDNETKVIDAGIDSARRSSKESMSTLKTEESLQDEPDKESRLTLTPSMEKQMKKVTGNLEQLQHFEEHVEPRRDISVKQLTETLAEIENEERQRLASEDPVQMISRKRSSHSGEIATGCCARFRKRKPRKSEAFAQEQPILFQVVDEIEQKNPSNQQLSARLSKKSLRFGSAAGINPIENEELDISQRSEGSVDPKLAKHDVSAAMSAFLDKDLPAPAISAEFPSDDETFKKDMDKKNLSVKAPIIPSE